MFEASAVNYDANLLYAMAAERFGESVYVLTMNLTTGNTTGVLITLPKLAQKDEKWFVYPWSCHCNLFQVPGESVPSLWCAASGPFSLALSSFGSR